MYEPITIPRNKKYGNNYWIGQGPKVKMREVALYSDLEYDNWVSIELNSNVVTYCEQAERISYMFEGKLHSTIIDMRLLLKDGSEEIHEVKYRNELIPGHRNYERNMRQIGAQAEWCKLNGFIHRVIDESLLRTGRFVLGNRVKILGLIRNTTFKINYNDLLSFIGTTPTTLEKLQLEVDLPYYELQYACCWLTYKGSIQMDIESCALSHKTEVWKNE
jgi:hypothetical protein